MRTAFGIAVLSTLLLSGCNKTDTSNAAVPEPSFCDANFTFPNPTTVTGRALYQRRAFLSAPGGLGDTDPTNYPIRYAEVAVLQAGFGFISCGNTDATGNFSLSIPDSGVSYTLIVYSRASNNYVNASVLNNPTLNQPYTVSKSFIGKSNPSLGDMIAPAKSSLEGGAFNIFDQILKANEFLRGQTSNCTTAFSTCTPFTVAPKATVYWAPGVNPATYFGISTLISFFHQQSGKLFILGGDAGDTSTADTDHFDNSVIVHEYGHFLEASYWSTDSPGGSHDANSIIDPRLAWGEGWANFFSLAVAGDPTYRDTYGNSDGSTGIFFQHNLETNSPSRDVPTVLGEGNFREFSITRALWDMLDPHPVSGQGTNEAVVDDATAGFREFWTALTASDGLKSGSQAFRNYGLLMKIHAALTGHTNVNTILTAEQQRADLTDYASRHSAGGTCTYTLSTTGAGEDGFPENSNQFASNDFYHLVHSGGTVTINLNRTAGTGDIDLYVYNSSYVYGRESDIVASSHTTGGTESVSTSLPAGNYMINVNLYTEGTAESATYKLLINGSELCP